MSTGQGYLAKAALRPNKPDLNVDLVPTTNGNRDTAYPTTAAIATTGAQVLGPYDMIPLMSEGINEQYEYKDDLTLVGQSGIPGRDTMFKDINGPIEIEPHYLGLDNIWALTLGYETPSYNNSPTFDESQDGQNPRTALTTAGTTGTNLEDATSSAFTSALIGEWVRISVSGGASEGQVRRITAVPDTDNATITPAWSTNPGAGQVYQIARAFMHTFECAKDMHIVTFDSQYANYSTETSGNSSDVMLRFATLCFEKTVGIWEHRAVMINSMTFTHNVKDGVKISLEVIPFDLLLGSAVNTDSTTWKYSAGPTTPIHLQERIIPGDLTFRLGDWSSGTALDSGDNQKVSSWSLTINNNLLVDTQNSVSGVYRVEPVRNGPREITGSITMPRYESDTFASVIEADTVQMASAVYTGSSLTGSNISSVNTLKFWIRALKLTNVSPPITSEGAIEQTFDFKAVIPASASAGMPAVNNAKSEIVIQTINNNPFNALRAQNAE